MWNEFNIKTFPAETIVFRDGKYCPDLSTLENKPINKKYNLPVHIIYVGEIAGNNELNIELNTDNQNLFISVFIKNKLPAFFNIFIKNTGENSNIRGHIMLQNQDMLNYKCKCEYLSKNTGILLKNKLLAGKDSVSELSGTAIIKKDCENCDSDISFCAMVEKNAKVTFIPAQRVSSEPVNAEHSASIYKPNDFQIQYLRESGLGILEIQNTMKEAFINDFSLF